MHVFCLFYTFTCSCFLKFFHCSLNIAKYYFLTGGREEEVIDLTTSPDDVGYNGNSRKRTAIDRNTSRTAASATELDLSLPKRNRSNEPQDKAMPFTLQQSSGIMFFLKSFTLNYYYYYYQYLMFFINVNFQLVYMVSYWQ